MFNYFRIYCIVLFVIFIINTKNALFCYSIDFHHKKLISQYFIYFKSVVVS